MQSKRLDELELGTSFTLYNDNYILELMDWECNQLFWISKNNKIYCCSGSCIVNINEDNYNA